MPPTQHGFCAIDFGTSNSAIALPRPGGVELVELEAGQRSMPTAVFYAVEGLAGHEEAQRHYGRAVAAPRPLWRSRTRAPCWCRVSPR